MNKLSLDKKDALLVVDIQNDFLEGGALGIKNSGAIVSFINSYIAIFSQRSLVIFASQDFHPADHSSFQHMGGPWPVHCVAGSFGAEFSADLKLPADAIIISKAVQQDKEAYSAFSGTHLNKQLKKSGIRRLFIGGLATDYCVLHTVKDAIALGFAVIVLEDAICAVNLMAEDGNKAKAEMKGLGAMEITLKQLIP